MFPQAIPDRGADHLRVTHPFATLVCSKLHIPVRLACLRRAASVRSEPGSNSPRLNPRPEGPGIFPRSLESAPIIAELKIDRIRVFRISPTSAFLTVFFPSLPVPKSPARCFGR